MVGRLLLIIGCAESPLKSQMKVPDNPIEMKAKCSIAAKRQSVLLIYHLYKTIHMDALTINLLSSLVTVNDFHDFS